MLEPGGGWATSLGLMFTDLHGIPRATLVEREPIASGHRPAPVPRSRTSSADFADFIGTDDYFDAAVVGNPPFADTPLTDGGGRKHLSGLSVQLLFAKVGRPAGARGVLAMVVTRFVP